MTLLESYAFRTTTQRTSSVCGMKGYRRRASRRRRRGTGGAVCCAARYENKQSTFGSVQRAVSRAEAVVVQSAGRPRSDTEAPPNSGSAIKQE
jgi:hypothetical protein